MNSIETTRLTLREFSLEDFDLLVTKLLSDPRVVQFYYTYQKLTDLDEIRENAQQDFWKYFASSRAEHGLGAWAAYTNDEQRSFVGWAALLQHADEHLELGAVIATVDIPNAGSIRVAEKLGFEFESQIEAYGSDQMYLYRKAKDFPAQRL